MLAKYYSTASILIAFSLVTGCSPGLVTEEDKSDAIVAKAKAEAETKPKYSGAAVVQAAMDGKKTVIQQAIQDGNATTAVNFEGFSALHTAAFGGQLEIVQMLAGAGMKLDQVSEGKAMTALHTAAYNGHTAVVKYLLEQKMAVDGRDGEGKSALIHAASGPFPETVQVLLDAGANVNLADQTEGFTALMTAAAEGQLEVVKLLMAHGADPTMEDVDQDTALSFAMKRRQTEVVEFLSAAMKQQQD